MNKIRIYIVGLVVLMSLPQTGCIKEYLDPSSISDTQVISTLDGLVGLVNGMQLRYSVGRQSPLYQGFSASGLSTLEQKVLNLGNTDEVNLANGGSAVTAGNSIVAGLWTQSFLLLNESNRVLNNLNVTTNVNAQAVLQGYGSMYKALVIGTLATYFEKMPVTLGKSQPFITRDEALRQAVTLLEGAEKSLAGATSATEVKYHYR